jgi:hypothetical protein
MIRFFKRTRLLDGLWVLALAAYVLAGTPDVPFHGDESTTIWMSRDYYYIFIQRDLDMVRYSDPPLNATEQHLRLIAGTVNKYLYGFAWHADGFTVDQLNEQWDWGGDWEYNQTTGHAPTRDLLLTARWTSALLLAGGVALIFAIGRMASGAPAAYLASLYYALNPALLLNGRRAMMEGSLIFFALLVVLAGLLLLQKRSWWAAILLGIASGLAVASKHPNAFVVVLVFAICGLVGVFESIRQADEEAFDPDDLDPRTMQFATRDPYALLTMLIAAGVLALAVFFALTPVWWDDPFERVGQVISERQQVLDLQVSLYGGYDGPQDRLAGFLRQTFVVDPQYYEVPGWENFISDQIGAYEDTPWAGVSIGGSVPGAIVMVGLIVLGLWSLLRDPHRLQEVRLLVAVWGAGMLILLAAITPLEWQRYYLLAYLPVGVLAATGTASLLRSIRTNWRWLRMRREMRSEIPEAGTASPD